MVFSPCYVLFVISSDRVSFNYLPLLNLKTVGEHSKIPFAELVLLQYAGNAVTIQSPSLKKRG